MNDACLLPSAKRGDVLPVDDLRAWKERGWSFFVVPDTYEWPSPEILQSLRDDGFRFGLRGEYDLIRNRLGDATRARNDFRSLLSAGGSLWTMTVTRDAWSNQIDDLEYEGLRKTLRGLVKEAVAEGVEPVLWLGPRHVADGLASASRLLRDLGEEITGLGFDPLLSAPELKTEPEVVAGYFKSRLRLCEARMEDREAETLASFRTFLDAARPGTTWVWRGSPEQIVAFHAKGPGGAAKEKKVASAPVETRKRREIAPF